MRRKTILVVVTLLVCLVGFCSAQQLASAVWPLTNPSTGGTGLTVVTSGFVDGNMERFNFTELNGYTGPNSSQRIRKISVPTNTWPASQTVQIDTVFVEFTARPKTGVTFAVDSITLDMCAMSTGQMKANLYYSKDSTFMTSTPIAYNTGLTNNYLPLTMLSLKLAVGLTLNEGEALYFRAYPWVDNLSPAPSGKYLCLQNVTIKGTTVGTPVASLPTISTSAVTYISPSGATTGGTISSDGGGIVTERGVCWDTVATPTIDDVHTSDGTGTGSFPSQLRGLTPGRSYYVRAFATNSAGTAYGGDRLFSTLVSIVAPTVTTNPITSILVTTGISGGNVTTWGGDTVTARGICWNQIGAPTISDNNADGGNGLGSFVNALTGLTALTTYYVRAFATNSAGTAYGNEVPFTTQSPAPDVVKIVAKDGSGDYATVQAAFDAVPANYTGRYTIFVRRGIYKEKLLLTAGKVNVVLEGEDRDSTILTFDDYSGKTGSIGTSTSYSVAIDASDFVAMNITFENTATQAQAVALRTNADRQIYYNCRMLGFQDTYYTWGGSTTGRIYNKNCIIRGSVDFVFGRDIAVFDSCLITVNRNGGTITAASTEATSKYGYVFLDSRITSDAIGFDSNPITTFYLGRPWQSAPRTVFLRCEEPSTLNTAGWLAWNVSPALYAEYHCTGAGAGTTSRVKWSSQLSDSAAATYTIQNIFSRNSVSPAYAMDWVPVIPNVSFPTGIEQEEFRSIPTKSSLEQNYPNPFNPTTVVRYSVAGGGGQWSAVSLKVYDLLGHEVAVLVNEIQSPGNHAVTFDGSGLTSGVYVCQLRIGQAPILSRRMVLLR